MHSRAEYYRRRGLVAKQRAVWEVNMSDEKKVRLFANHLALSVRKQRDGSLALVEKYKDEATQRRLRSPHRDKLKLAKFRSYAAVDRALADYCGKESPKRRLQMVLESAATKWHDTRTKYLRSGRRARRTEQG
jgi:hypothetical protein